MTELKRQFDELLGKYTNPKTQQSKKDSILDEMREILIQRNDKKDIYCVKTDNATINIKEADYNQIRIIDGDLFQKETSEQMTQVGEAQRLKHGISSKNG
jgi:hypothetical protein